VVKDVQKAIEIVRQGFGWSQSSRRNLSISVAVCVLLVCLGGYLAFILPGQVVAKSLDVAEAEVVSAQNLLNTARNRFNAESTWYKKDAGYVDSLPQLLSQAASAMSSDANDGAADLLAIAKKKVDPDKAKKLAKQAQDRANEVSGFARQVLETLNAIHEERRLARVNLGTIQGDFATTQSNLGAVQVRFDNVSGHQLSKYVDPVTEELAQAQTALTQTVAHIQAASGLLPHDDDTSQVGDPSMAQAELDQAKVQIDKINTKVQSVTASLDYWKEAESKAGETKDRAGTDVSAAWNRIDAKRVARGYTLELALSEASRLYKEAKIQYEAAITTLTTHIEGDKIDYPLAYEQALASIDLSAQCITEVNEQVRAHDSALTKLAQFNPTLNSVEGYLATARDAHSVLVLHHKASVWAAESDNVTTAETNITSALASKAEAERRLGSTVQDYPDAETKAQEALNLLSSAQVNANALISKKNELERYRSDWPGAESSAVSTISTAAGKVRGHERFSSRSVMALSDAESSLFSARSYVSSKDWQAAVDAAKKAKTHADNAGSWVVTDEQGTRSAWAEETRVAKQKTRDAQAAQTRAAEAASAAATRAASWDDDSSSSSGSSGGSWGGSSGSDSGSWGGSSVSDSGSWGGGSSGSDSSSW
jgi:hypothetical protein